MGSASGKPAPAVPSTLSGQRWELVSRPHGMVTVEDFALRSETIRTDQLELGECIVAAELLSIDAFLRTTLDKEAYHGAIELGGVLPALGYGKVVASRNKKFAVGKRVTGMLGARSVARLNQEEASQLFPMLSLPGVQPSTFMGLLGLTSGLTAWVGIHSVTKPPRRGQTVVVSGAAGATGSVAAQLARLTGARVVGIAGGPQKAAYLREQLQLHGAVDYKDGACSVAQQLDALCPDGIDFFFDTVGGETLDDVLCRIRKNGRVVICGASSQYNGNLNVCSLLTGPPEQS